jgi:hypothetical protein
MSMYREGKNTQTNKKKKKKNNKIIARPKDKK